MKIIPKEIINTDIHKYKKFLKTKRYWYETKKKYSNN